MHEKRSNNWSQRVLGVFGSAAGVGLTALCLSVVPTRNVQAQAVTQTACAATWNAASAYNGGDNVSENGVNYQANWWTRGDDPATHSGATGSGQPWTSLGACGDGGGGGGGGGGGSGGSCAGAWSAGTVYNGGDTASENGVNYTANWWTQGDDPATNSGPGGSGQPWTVLGDCDSGGSGGGNNPPTANFSDSVNGLTVNFTDASSDSDGSVVSRAWSFGDGSTSTATNPSHSYAAGGTYTVTLTATDDDGASDTRNASVTVSSGGGGGNPPPAGFIFSPYKDVTINLNWNTDIMSTKVTGSAIPVVGSGSLVSDYEPNLGAITLAFATGTCGNESWGGVPADSFASANIQSLDDAGVNYIISTGGAAGTFSCSNPSGMVQFIQRYDSPHLVGIDFDIEGGQTPAQLNALVSQVAYAEQQYPNLRFSFTLATLAASDGSYGGLNSLGATVMNAIQSASLPRYTINLMAMDFGSASPGVCVVANGQCDMGQSAIQAVQNLEHTYGVPASQIEVTSMIGVNDVSSELFTLNDVDTLTSYATSHGLAGVHYWSLDRDTPCSGGYASPTCNSVPSSSVLGYTDRFLQDFGQ